MNSKQHFILSVIKSLIRIIGCCCAMFSGVPIVYTLGFTFFLAELIGILEEIFDKR